MGRILPGPKGPTDGGWTGTAASRWRRLWACLVDAFILTVPILAFMLGMTALFWLRHGAFTIEGPDGRQHLTPDARRAYDQTMAAARWLANFAWAIYTITFVARSGQTPGKRMWQITVVAVAGGAAPGWVRAAERWAVVVAPSVILAFTQEVSQLRLFNSLLWLLSFAVVAPVLFDPLRRGLHDLAAGTLVEDARRPTRAPVESTDSPGMWKGAGGASPF